MTDLPLLITGAILCLIAIATVIAEDRRFRAHERWCAAAAKADGVVSRIGMRGHLSRNKPSSDDNRITHVPVVRFKAAKGAEHEFDAPRAPNEVGAAVKVAYDPNLPSTARVVDQPRRFGCAIVLGAAGLAMIGSGLT